MKLLRTPGGLLPSITLTPTHSLSNQCLYLVTLCGAHLLLFVPLLSFDSIVWHSDLAGHSVPFYLAALRMGFVSIYSRSWCGTLWQTLACLFTSPFPFFLANITPVLFRVVTCPTTGRIFVFLVSVQQGWPRGRVLARETKADSHSQSQGMFFPVIGKTQLVPLHSPLFSRPEGGNDHLELVALQWPAGDKPERKVKIVPEAWALNQGQ